MKTTVLILVDKLDKNVYNNNANFYINTIVSECLKYLQIHFGILNGIFSLTCMDCLKRLSLESANVLTLFQRWQCIFWQNCANGSWHVWDEVSCRHQLQKVHNIANKMWLEWPAQAMGLDLSHKDSYVSDIEYAT